ncbi:hypothetical protein [Bacteroides sp.]
MDNAMKLEADKMRLVRAIVNIDNETLLKKVKEQLHGVLNLNEETKVLLEEDSDEYIAEGIRESLKECNKVRKGKALSRPVEDLLNEL